METSEEYVLQESDIEVLKSLFERLNDEPVRKNRSFSIGFERIEMASIRTKPVDSLIDTMIALEALVLSDAGDPRERGEMRFRLSLRIARFLSNSYEERKQISRNVKNAYDLRSAVVHGGLINAEDKVLISQIAETARQVARKLLLQPTRPDWEQLLLDDSPHEF